MQHLRIGLQSTLMLKRQQPRFQNDKLYIQIIFDKEDHWIVASMIFTKLGHIKVYDSIYTTINKETEAIYGPTVSLHLVRNINKQKGGVDCDLFAIVIATTLALRLDPAEIIYVII